MLLTEKITLLITVWILFVALITGEDNLEIFFIMILVGVIVIREVTDLVSSNDLKGRMNLFIYFFLLFFLVIVFRRIMGLLIE